ncbi:MAG: MTAP family purine nucleoside phosphorylase [Planctomycetota bacterium]
MSKTAPAKVNDRANMYALKDLGVRFVLGWGAAGAIVHEMSIGEVVILLDLIDRTYLRTRTFFEDSPLGYLRQFPVFCPALRSAACNVIHRMELPHHDSGTAAICEGPRLETPAEIRMLAGMGAELVTHTFIPEVFLARELQLCYAAICYVVSYAETGSAYRPFVPGRLFAGASRESDTDRLAKTVGAMGSATAGIVEAVEKQEGSCECRKAMDDNIRRYGLAEDWRKWFEQA